MNTHFKIWETAALLALCITLGLCTWAQGKQQAISADLVRLHVIAVSDAPEEQACKLRVRDAVLDYLTPVMENVPDREAALALLHADLDGIRRAAESASEGRPVQVSLGRERYPVRQYAGFTLPAGEYESLRVTLGDGAGHNWWCIVFPPLCLQAVGGDSLRSVMSREDSAIVCEEEGYELRFRIVERWGEFLNCIHGQNTLYCCQNP